MKSIRRAVNVFLALILLSIAAIAAPTEKWSEAKARDWYAKQPWLIGSNYNPASAIKAE